MTDYETIEYAYEIFNDMYDYTSKKCYALNIAISAFGYNIDTFDAILYVMFGMETQAFIDAYENGEL